MSFEPQLPLDVNAIQALLPHRYPFLMVDRGYHPWVSAPGYCGYHLWFHGGEAIGLRPRIDPALAWVGKTVPMLRQRQEGK